MITGTLRQPGKVTMLQKCMLLFLGCFFFGVFLANFSLHDEALWIGFLHENQVRQFAGAEDVEHAEALLKTILLQRGLPWMILLIALCFRFGCAVCAIWFGWLGLSGGFVFAALLGRYGFSGIGQMGILGFPQVAAYAAAYIFLLVLMEAGKRVRQERRNAHLLQNKPDLKAQALLMVLFLLDTGIYGAGIWLEYWVNPWILLHTAVVG